MSDFLQVIVPACIGALPAIIIAINTNRLIAYRVDELTKKVEKHNQIVERVFKVESDMSTMWRRHDELREDVNLLKQTTVHSSKE